MRVIRVILLAVFLSSVAFAAKDLPFDKVLFVKRFSYSANHYYTEYLNSKWLPGGNLCVLDVGTGEVEELVPELEGGVFGRFDIDFDARHVVFAWKRSKEEGYRLYEIGIDPESGERVGKLRQVTFPEADEAALIERYELDYHHGTDDMHPCYLPDGGIVFISTRCQYGILCNGPDSFTTTTLFRVDRDGSNMKQLSFGALSEAAPSIMHDGRILYTRWEYVDKGAVSVKCLWAMKPDGSYSSEIYGNDIAFPPTMINARPLPGTSTGFVMLGTPHFPQNATGTVIRLDITKNIRTTEPMTYMTPDVDIRLEGGFHFKVDGEWVLDRDGKTGPLFKDPYPLTEETYLVSHKEAGLEWKDPTGYNLAILERGGEVSPVYNDPAISCFEPFPLMARKRPPVLGSSANPELAEKGLAACIVTDVYHGLEGIARGEVKYIRVLEQIPRPWTARRNWDGDLYDQQHATISKDTHLALKVQHGVVPVEEDGSAHFLVPANKNIFFQVLDENYMALQTERTFVNYTPGESRACIGCHETPDQAPQPRSLQKLLALQRAPSIPGPQLGETSGQRPIGFVADVQPVLDRHCIDCHSGEDPEGGLNLSGEMTLWFSVAYESLIEHRRDVNAERTKRYKRFNIPLDGLEPIPVFGRDKDGPLLIGPTIGENHPKTGNVHYMPTKSFGSHASVLVAMLAPGKVELADPEAARRAAHLAESHNELELSKEELLRITNWVDTNAQFYGMYWGRRGIEHKDHPNFRPKPTFERAISMQSLIPEEER